MNSKRLVIVSNETGMDFAKEVAENIDAELIETDIRKYPDEELYTRVLETIRGADVFFICPYYPHPLERHSESLIISGTITGASAGRLTMVPTYMGFQRSDWKDDSRVAIAVRDAAMNIESEGVDRVLTMHLHAPQIQGMFRIPMDVLQAFPVFKKWYDNRGYSPGDVVVVSPDAGGTKYAERFAGIIGVNKLGMIWKKRLGGHEVDSHAYAGNDVAGMTVLMPDDQFSTGESLRKGAKRLKEKHGAREVYGCITHAVCAPSKDGRLAEDLLLEDEYLDGLVTTDTIPRPTEWVEKYMGKIEVLSIVKNFGDAIHRIHNDESLSDLFQY